MDEYNKEDENINEDIEKDDEKEKTPPIPPRVCPRCGEILTEDETVCPSCGCDDLPIVKGSESLQQAGEDDDIIETIPGSEIQKYENFMDTKTREKFEKNHKITVGEAHKSKRQIIGQLVAKVRQGDEQATTDLIHMTEAGLMCYADKYYLNDKGEAADVVQETFIHNLQVIGQLRDDESFLAWMTKSVRNRSINVLRKRARRKTDVMTDRDTKDEEGKIRSFQDERPDVSGKNDPVSNLNKNEILNGLQNILDEIPKNQKECLYCRVFQGFSTKQTAEILNIPEGTVKSNVNYAKKYLKKRLVALQKQGKAFFGIAPIPFFIWLVEREIQKAHYAPIVIHASTIKPIKEKKKSAQSAKKTIENSAGKAVVKSASSKIVGKVLLAAIVGVGAVAGGKTILDNSKKENTKTHEVAKAANKGESSKKEDVKSKYQPVIKQYAEKLKDSIKNPTTAYVNGVEDVSEQYMTHDDDAENRLENYGFAYIDINDDGVSELLIGSTKSSDSDYMYPKGSFYYLYTIDKDNKPELVNIADKAFDEEVSIQALAPYNYYLSKDNKIYCTSTDGSEAELTKENKIKVIKKFEVDTMQPTGLPESVSKQLKEIKYTPFSEILDSDDKSENSESKESNNNKTDKASSKVNEYGAYNDILEKYYNYLAEDTDMSADGMDEICQDTYGAGVRDGLNSYGFAVMDINNDGNDELLIGNLENPDRILKLYIMKNGMPEACQYLNLNGQFVIDNSANYVNSWTYHYSTSLLSDGRLYHYGPDSTYDDESIITLKSDGAYIQETVGYVKNETMEYHKWDDSINDFSDIDEQEYNDFVSQYKSQIQTIQFTPFSQLKK